jgi:hypothetical protein
MTSHDLQTLAPQRKHERTLRLLASTVDAKTAMSANVLSIFILCDIVYGGVTSYRWSLNNNAVFEKRTCCVSDVAVVAVVVSCL